MVSSEDSKIQYTLSGTFPTTFSVPFKYWAKDEIIVILSFDDGTADQTLVQDTDYSITDPDDTGTITAITTWDADAVRLTIYRNLDILQETDYADGTTVPMSLLEQDFDRLCAMIQQVKEVTDRQSTIPITDSGAAVTLPSRSTRANKILGFDDDGDAEAVDVVATPVTDFMKTLLEDESAAEGLATLGLTATAEEINAVCDVSAIMHVVSSADCAVSAAVGHHYYFLATGTAMRTATLPAAPVAYQVITILKTDPSNLYLVLINGNGKTVDGYATYYMAQSITLVYDGTSWISINGDAGAWPGKIIKTGKNSTTPRLGYLYCDNSALSRTTYANLFAEIGTAWGYGDGSTTFNLPDPRGRSFRGRDGGVGRDPDRASRTANAAGGNTGDNVGTVQEDAFHGHGHMQYYYDATGMNGGSGVERISNSLANSLSNSGVVMEPITYGSYGTPRISSETRGKNAGVNYFIKF